ncbi:hypothetical protein EZ449_19550 [Pedobacter frigidisoli]|uniref:Glycosyltransferase, catalytic subunit of cellulose synthase and poly-beta-1,6-N-acetylglucosamine synthase n=1 Tax=Pedobacter frigidisoli TaxID=2530455 RepID=A0A4R0NQC2_9SPHI|nr:glycosyltransferase [Pedobacter frigidisoli]TCD01993.1 hypothetical protein EZ449_19550 [Pedobacter frigidisoli]
MISDILNICWLIIQLLIGYNLVLPLLMAVISGFFKNAYLSTGNQPKYDYAIVVTAYEQTGLLPQVIASLLKLNYSNYIIYLVADKCDTSNLFFDDDKVILLKPETVLASNIKSHQYAIENFIRPHDIITIIDSDNLTDPEYINELNVFFDNGFEAVQGLRKAKNLNTTFACLDAARDLYYHYYDGEILFKLGSSATLAGSGMAFKTNLYQACITDLAYSGAGFDKVVQAKILLAGKRIAFAKKAIVYDEKTTNAAQLVNQRSRWINTWFRFSKFGLDILAQGIKKGNINQSLFGLIVIRPPLFIFLILSVLFLGISLIIGSSVYLFWIMGLLSFVIGFAISLVRQPTDPKIYKSLINIPKFIFFQVVSLIHAKGANKRSVATKHIINTQNS